MFFRRKRHTELTFQQRLENLKGAGFGVTPRPDGTVMVSKGECAVALREAGGQVQRAEVGSLESQLDYHDIAADVELV